MISRIFDMADPQAGGIDATQVHVFLDGEDVSKRCFRSVVPEEPGVEGPGQVCLYKRNSDGCFYIDPATMALPPEERRPAQEVLEGIVRWEPRMVQAG